MEWTEKIKAETLNRKPYKNTSVAKNVRNHSKKQNKNYIKQWQKKLITETGKKII